MGTIEENTILKYSRIRKVPLNGRQLVLKTRVQLSL